MKSLSAIFFVTLCLLYFSPINLSAQGVGINESSAAPDPSALLDLNATDKGFLITRADTSNIASPAFGLMTLAPKDSCMYLYNGDYWIGMSGAGSNCSCSCEPSTTPFVCGSLLTDARDSKTYGSVQIGNQCWMSENLAYLPAGGDSWCFDDVNSNCDIFGRLYGWDAASGGGSSSTNPSGLQGICPDDWHLPSDDEWKEMEMFLGMSQVEADNTGWRGTNEGTAIKTNVWNGNNSSGFKALPGGYRYANGTYSVGNQFGFWWNSTLNTMATAGMRRGLNINQSKILRNAGAAGTGMYVRCVKD